MSKEIGENIRQIRELKGFSQEYLADKLGVSQRAYSKIERAETKVDWEKIKDIAVIFEMEPSCIVSFDAKLIFSKCSQTENTYSVSDQLIKQYEERIAHLEAEIEFLRGLIIKK